MGYQIRLEPALQLYRIEGEGPLGFAVIGSNTLLGNLSGNHISEETAALKAGVIARETVWVALDQVTRLTVLDYLTLLNKLSHRRESTMSLFILVPDYEPDAVGGHLLIGDIWHRGHVRDAIGNNREIYIPHAWALLLLKELRDSEAASATAKTHHNIES